MKNKNLFLTALLITMLQLPNLAQSYNHVKIGSQIWMTENLNVDRFRNGELIPEAKTAEEWKRASDEEKPAWCYYDNNVANGAKYGKLYNWYAVGDPRGLAPKGWHVPEEKELVQFYEFLGYESPKITSTSGWIYNQNGTNSTGFSGQPGGLRSDIGKFIMIGEMAFFWNSKKRNDDYAVALRLTGSKYNLMISDETIGNGYSVRCLMGEEIKSIKKEFVPIANELNSAIKKVKIGNQEWMAENLNVEKFRNGDPIPHARKAEEWEAADKNKQPAWCYYDNNIEQGAKYGKLYNWFAVNDPRGLAPKDWHIPSNTEWTQLCDYLGGRDVSGIKLKSKTGFNEKVNATTNQSSFSGLPGGSRSRNGYFGNAGGAGFWWTATEDYAFDNRKDVVQIWTWRLTEDSEYASKYLEEHGKGFSVRCISGSVPKIEVSNNQLNNNKVANENKIFQANIIYNFKEVTIGNQIWMEVNLNSDKFRNGEPIPEAKTKEEWKYKGENKQPAWCYYNYESANGLKYGKLYNWYAVNDARGLAPAGWHIPSDQEWSQIIIFLGGTDNAGIKIKSKAGWFDKTTCGTNESGFNGLPGGYCGSYGNSNSIGYNGYWWCSDEIEKFKGFYRSAGNFMNINACYKGIVSKMEGYSVRCIKN